MKIALLIAGEVREFEMAKAFWPFLNIPDIDIYMSTWSTSVKQNPINNETITEIIDRSTLEKSLNFKKLIIEDLPTSFAWGVHLYLYKIRGLIETVVAENIQYDIVIVIRPDLIFKVFPTYDLVEHILANVKHDNIIHTITNNWKIADTRLTTDVLFIGTLNTVKKFLTFIPNHPLDYIPTMELTDIHAFVGKSYIDNGIEVDNLPIHKWTIARPNSRGKNNPTFEDLEKDAKKHWEYRYKNFFGSTENVYLSLNAKEPIMYPKLVQNKTLNLFDEFDYNRWDETDGEYNWYSTDNKRNYSKAALLKRHAFKEDAITYKFNSLGFRIPACNFPLRFEDAYGYPTFMAAGCSFTEGVGLPEDKIWHSYLMEKFIQNNDTNRPIVKLNTGKSGLGIDAIVRYVYVSIEKYGARPDIIYILLPNISRQELIVEDDNSAFSPVLHKMLVNETSLPDFLSVQQKDYIVQRYKMMTNIREVYHASFKSLLFLKYYLEAKKIPWFFSSWSNDFTVEGIKKYIPNIDTNDIRIPAALDQHHMNIDFTAYRGEHKYHMARDGMHLGPIYHQNFSKNVYDNIANTPTFQEVRKKWKT